MKLLQPHPDFMHRAEPTVEARSIPVFADIIRRDRGSTGDHDGRYKQQACKELAWIFHVTDPDSPYFQVSKDHRKEVVTKAIFPEEDWQPDELVLQGLEKYNEIITSPSIRLLESAMNSIDKLEKYFNSINFDSKKEDEELHDPKDVIANLEKLGRLVTSLRELKKQVEKDHSSEAETYGGHELNQFSR